MAFQSQATLALVKCLKSSAYAQLVGTIAQLMKLEVVYLPSTFAVSDVIRLFLLICSLHTSTKTNCLEGQELNPSSTWKVPLSRARGSYRAHEAPGAGGEWAPEEKCDFGALCSSKSLFPQK